ncbi:MAG: hypothetical protein JWL90_3893 [Chthoniobacteraceae bacterium]|nr:hypothetical protein [Chthoniobacteraceae bacterium]
MNLSPSKLARIVFDEFHSESWSISAARAAEMQPDDPANASYEMAAGLLAARDFCLERNISKPLDDELLNQAEVLALIHPCDPRWEQTTSRHSPALSATEMESVLKFVQRGGGLLLITEYEHDKYGDNFNELLATLGLRIENGKAFDKTRCAHENPEWLIAEPAGNSPLGHLAQRACFYRTGWCVKSAVENSTAEIAWHASAAAHPPNAGVIALARLGKGRVAVVSDSVLFGDERIQAFEHRQLWINLLYWLAAPGFSKHLSQGNGAEVSPGTTSLIKKVNELRILQERDGSVAPASHAAAALYADLVLEKLALLRPEFPHQNEYFDALGRDLERWITGGFSKPDFAESLGVFRPELERRDGLTHLVLFPMYTPNASSETRFEALLMRTAWPDWLAQLEETSYRNPKFVPGHFLAFSAGYESECAVLFPETVSLKARASNHFGVIFCDREARRLQRYASRAADAVGLMLYPELECLLGSMPLLLETMALWDLIHDTSHSLGELPFDPFMIRQRAPFWMYGLEELRVDLRTFEEATRLAAAQFPFARHVCAAILLDRIFRFPITGTRVRNYDALGGQLLFAFLHQHDVLLWTNNRLTVRWEMLPAGIHALREELTGLYKLGADCSKVSFWLAAHDLIARYLRPNVASRWKAGTREVTDETDPKKWIGLVHEDEFPLGSFHLNLLRKIGAAS